MKKFLEIAILSYNRISELERAFKSIESITSNDVQIVVYEDCSPNQEKINEICIKYSQKLNLKIEFKPSKKNLGYDQNLLRALRSDSEYVFLLSDDDYINENFFMDLLNFLKKKNPDIAICSFFGNTIHRTGSHFKKNFSIDVLYDSVLFSGLIFKPKKILLNEEELAFLKNSIYVQVYLVCKHWNETCVYFKEPIVKIGADGENFFGKSDSTLYLEKLKNRESMLSNLYYHEHFQPLVERCLESFYPNLQSKFLKNYSARLVSHFIRTRLKCHPMKYYSLVNKLNGIDIKYKKSYLIFIYLIGLIPKFVIKPLYGYMLVRFRVSGG